MHKRRKASVPSSGLFFRRFEETEKTYKHHILLLLPVWAAVTALSSAATALPSGHVPQWNGRLRPALVSGGLLILAAGIIHCIGKPKKKQPICFPARSTHRPADCLWPSILRMWEKYRNGRISLFLSSSSSVCWRCAVCCFGFCRIKSASLSIYDHAGSSSVRHDDFRYIPG